jgi:hypothetical protein
MCCRYRAIPDGCERFRISQLKYPVRRTIRRLSELRHSMSDGRHGRVRLCTKWSYTRGLAAEQSGPETAVVRSRTGAASERRGSRRTHLAFMNEHRWKLCCPNRRLRPRTSGVDFILSDLKTTTATCVPKELYASLFPGVPSRLNRGG